MYKKADKVIVVRFVGWTKDMYFSTMSALLEYIDLRNEKVENKFWCDKYRVGL